MQIYIETNLMYGFDKQKMFRVGYMTENIGLNQELRGYNQKS